MHSAFYLCSLILLVSVLSDPVIISYDPDYVSSSDLQQALLSSNIDPNYFNFCDNLPFVSGDISEDSKSIFLSHFTKKQIKITDDIYGSLASEPLHIVSPTTLSVSPYLAERVISVNTTALLYYGDEPTNWNWGLSRISENEGEQCSPFFYPESAGKNVHVWIIDSGINGNNPEFANCNWDAISMVSPFRNVSDMVDHGTSVASLVCGDKFGVAKKASVHIVKVTNSKNGIMASFIIKAIDFVMTKVDMLGKNVLGHIINLPLVFNVADNPAMAIKFLEQTFAAAVNKDILIVAAAGNEAGDACNWTPARLGVDPVNGVMTVGNIKDTDEGDTFTNYGSCVTLYAPGSKVAALKADGTCDLNSGTSFSASITAGVAALYLGRAGGTSSGKPKDIINHLLNIVPNKLAQITLPNGSVRLEKVLFSGYSSNGVTPDSVNS